LAVFVEKPVKRPQHLPDFGNPPLNEVILGIQFNSPPGYQQIMAGDVWSLFKSRFPKIQELPPLPPVFETFGQPRGAQINFGFVTGPQHNRFWFLTDDGVQLIQFQNDRFLHNWRKLAVLGNEYPRFEAIIADFQAETSQLESFFVDMGAGPLTINQCEISYINHIYPPTGGRINPYDWLSIFNFGTLEIDDFSVTFRRRITNSDGKPIGRLICEGITNARPEDGQEFIQLSLTVRGVPNAPNLESALEFLVRGREIIVSQFADITTESAHRLWERKQ
jgi:uncharacterized protein (TIGR04255 family)